MEGEGSVSQPTLADNPDVNYVSDKDEGETLPMVSCREPLERCEMRCEM